MKFKDRFFQLLKQRSQERGWQSAFAEQAGIRQSSLSQIINGTTKSPSLDNVGAIVDTLGVENFYGPGKEKNVSGTKDALPAVPLWARLGQEPRRSCTAQLTPSLEFFPSFIEMIWWL